MCGMWLECMLATLFHVYNKQRIFIYFFGITIDRSFFERDLVIRHSLTFILCVCVCFHPIGAGETHSRCHGEE